MADIVCAECGKTFATADRLRRHQRMAPDHTAPAPTKAATGKKPAASPLAVLEQAVGNARTLGAFLAGTIAPHVGVAIAGTEDGRVASRAVMAGNLLRDRIEKDARVLRLLVAFNRLFEVPEGLTLATSMIAAAAVDAGRVTPDWEVTVPVLGTVKPVQLAIGDVVAYVAEHAEPAPPAAASPNSHEAEPAPVGMDAT